MTDLAAFAQYAQAFELERRFDVRIPEILEGPRTRDDGVWMRFRLTNTRKGLPDLVLEGEHLTRYRDGRIVAIEERLLGEAAERCKSYLETHDAALKPIAAAAAPLGDPSRESDLRLAVMRSLVRSYGAAKSERDIEAALAVCHGDRRK